MVSAGKPKWDFLIEISRNIIGFLEAYINLWDISTAGRDYRGPWPISSKPYKYKPYRKLLLAPVRIPDRQRFISCRNKGKSTLFI